MEFSMVYQLIMKWLGRVEFITVTRYILCYGLANHNVIITNVIIRVTVMLKQIYTCWFITLDYGLD